MNATLLNPSFSAATPSAVKSDPPDVDSDMTEARPWGSSAPYDDSADRGHSDRADEARPQRTTKMVGSIVDPSAKDDGLTLTGPGAPAHSFEFQETAHPVRARLLRKAQDAKLGLATEETSSSAAPPPVSSSMAPASSPARKPPPPRVPPPSRPPLAQEAASQKHHDSDDGQIPEFVGTPPPAAVVSELNRIARRTSEQAPGPRTTLSPNMIALLGGLIGLTMVSSLGIYLGKTKTSLLAPAPAPVATQAVAVEKSPVETAVEQPIREKVKGPWRIADDAAKPGNKVIEGKVGKKAFLRAIQDAGLSKNDAYRAYAALKGLKNLDQCRSTDSFQALVGGTDKNLIAFEYNVTKEEVYQAKLDKSGNLTGAKLDLQVSRNQIRRSFTHDGKSFDESAKRAGFDSGLATVAEAALRGHSRLRDFKRGDQLRVVAQEVTVLGEFSRYSGIEALEILRSGEEPRRIYYYPHPVEGGHFDKNGRAPYEGGWRKPITTAPVTSKFNMKRMHPVLNRVMPHTGTDFGAPTGTPIGATAPGVVSFRGPGGASGNLVKIKHDGGYESGYAHLSKFAKVHVGDKVDRMQVIGYCGTTGRSTGPHLHFTMKKDGKYIDAESLSLDGLRVLPKAHRDAFAEVRAKYDPVFDEIPLPQPLLPLDAASLAPSASASATQEEDPMRTEGGMMPDAVSAPEAPLDEAKAAVARPSAPAQPAKSVKPSAIFLTDSELLRIQGLNDDGEVDE